MFDNFTKKLATKMGRSVQKAAEPIRAEVRKNANHKVDLYSKILRMGVLIFLFIDGTRRVTDAGRSDSGPSQIIINNYLGDKKEGR